MVVVEEKVVVVPIVVIYILDLFPAFSASIKMDKKCLSVGQMIKWRDISIEIHLSDSMPKKLVDPSSSPGPWVGNTTVARIQLLNNIFSTDLMNHIK